MHTHTQDQGGAAAAAAAAAKGWKDTHTKRWRWQSTCRGCCVLLASTTKMSSPTRDPLTPTPSARQPPQGAQLREPPRGGQALRVRRPRGAVRGGAGPRQGGQGGHLHQRGQPARAGPEAPDLHPPGLCARQVRKARRGGAQMQNTTTQPPKRYDVNRNRAPSPHPTTRSAPFLLDHPDVHKLFPRDAIARARAYLTAVPGERAPPVVAVVKGRGLTNSAVQRAEVAGRGLHCALHNT